MVDMHKEIKLSDLFKRKAKDPGEAQAEKPPKEEKPKRERRRRERTPKRANAPKSSAASFAHEAPPLPEIPLMRAFNLLPKEEVRQAKEKQSALPQVLVALVGVLVFAALAALYLMAGTDATKKRSEVDDLRAELAPYQAAKEQPSLEDKSAALTAERVQRTAALGAAVAGRLAWDRVLRELALVLPDDVRLDTIQATSPTAPGAPAPVAGVPVKNFTLTGSTDSQAGVAQLLARLSVIPELSAVRLESAQAPVGEQVAGEGAVTFTITGTLRSGP